MDVLKLRFFGNILDRFFCIFLASSLSLILNLGFFSFLFIFIAFDFVFYCFLRWAFDKTPGDILTGIRLRTQNLFFLRLILRWILGYLSSLFFFMGHLQVIAGRKSLCDEISGIEVELRYIP